MLTTQSFIRSPAAMSTETLVPLKKIKMKKVKKILILYLIYGKFTTMRIMGPFQQRDLKTFKNMFSYVILF